MDFLECYPSVFVIGNEYEILLVAKKNGILSIKISDETFYEENSGTLSSEKNYAKIRIPQETLNQAKSYEVIFRESIDRKAYFSELGEVQTHTFAFHPLEKTENIRIYHIADIHYHYDFAVKTCAYFGDDTDLYIVNGDLTEMQSEQNYVNAARFVGEISKGNVPVIFTRGNHDTRGRLAERYTDYFPANGKNTYYTFSVGCLQGLVLDCGEDKWDAVDAYGGTNAFEIFRKRELRFLKETQFPDNGKITVAISHVAPAVPTFEKGGQFDIDRETYAEMCQELNRMSLKFMIIGHFHSCMLLPPNSEKSIQKHNYPIVVGSELIQERSVWGTAIILNKHRAEIFFTDHEHHVQGKEILEF